jgi:Ca2+-binding EF-hand superfamily protein
MKVLWILALLLSAAMAAGQGQNQPSFSWFDANADGTITKAEFDEGHQKRIEQRKAEGKKMEYMGGTMTFDDLDSDGDGMVTQEEFTEHQSDESWGCFDNAI